MPDNFRTAVVLAGMVISIFSTPASNVQSETISHTASCSMNVLALDRLL